MEQTIFARAGWSLFAPAVIGCRLEIPENNQNLKPKRLKVESFQGWWSRMQVRREAP
jgi:hypothetical protein